MKKLPLLLVLLMNVLLASFSNFLAAAEVRVAVASNFFPAVKVIAKRFEADTGHKVILISGATGKHYAQIKNGAPFDLFFAADSHRPARLEKEGVALPGTRFTYAIGKLVLWSPRSGYVDLKGSVLENGKYRFLAIANPKLAPYGRAAQEVLQARGLWDGLTAKLVRGENINQTYLFVISGNAELGFVSYSLLKRPGRKIIGSYWEIPQSLYSVIEQQAVLLKDSAVARQFMSFVRSEVVSKIVRDHGYERR